MSHSHVCTNRRCGRHTRCHHERREDCLRDDMFECLECCIVQIERSIARREAMATPVIQEKPKEPFVLPRSKKNNFRERVEAALFDYKKET